MGRVAQGVAGRWLSNDSGWAPGVYERWFRWNPHQAALRRREEAAVLAVIGSHDGGLASVIEVGAGTGHYTMHLARRAGRVHATDSTPAMRSYLERRVAGAGLANVSVGEARLPALGDGDHDLAVTVGVLNYLPDLAESLRGLAGTTHDRGAVVFTVPLATPGGRLYEASELLSRHKVWLHTPAGVEAAAAAAGLRVEHTERAGFTRAGLTYAVRAVKA